MRFKVFGAVAGLVLGLVHAQGDSRLLTEADEAAIGARSETHAYQSDISRLMKTVVHSLYHDREVFIRELLSNANDAIEKTRILSLTDPAVLDTNPSLNVSILVDKPSKRIVIRGQSSLLSELVVLINL